MPRPIPVVEIRNWRSALHHESESESVDEGNVESEVAPVKGKSQAR